MGSKNTAYACSRETFSLFLITNLFKMKNPILYLLSLSVLIFSCKKSSLDDTNTGLKGGILLVDEYNHPSNDYSGVVITSENSDVANISINGKGEFNFPNLVNNSNDLKITVSKPGYGTVTNYYTKAQLDNFRIQQSMINDFVLLPKSSVTVNSLSGVIDGDKFKMAFNVSLAKDRATNGVTLFLIKNNSQVSFDNWTGNIADSRSWTVPVTSGDNLHEFCFTPTPACPCDFVSSGDTVFLRAYGDTYSMFDNRYIDNLTGKLIFPNINPNSSSSTISFIVP